MSRWIAFVSAFLLVTVAGCAKRPEPCEGEVLVQAVLIEHPGSLSPSLSDVEFVWYTHDGNRTDRWMGDFSANDQGCGTVPLGDQGTYEVRGFLPVPGCDFWSGRIVFEHSGGAATHEIPLHWEDDCQPRP